PADQRMTLTAVMSFLRGACAAEIAHDPGEAVAAFARDRVHPHAADRHFGRLRSGVVDQFLLRELVDADAVALLPVLGQILSDVHPVEVDVLILAQRSVDRHIAGEALAVERDTRLAPPCIVRAAGSTSSASRLITD